MDNRHDHQLDLDDRRDELGPALRTSTSANNNKSFFFQRATSPSNHNVETLLLRNNQLNSMKPYAKALNEMRFTLRELTLRNNAFIQFPLDILVLVNLTSLSLAKNKLHNIQCSIFTQLPHLTWLSLSHNYLQSLPDDLRSCNRLKGLDISNNQFQVMPLVISQLDKLQVLLIQKNQLRHLPDYKHVFPESLHTLNIAFNDFHSLPSLFVSAPPSALTHLHLSGNPLRELPSNFLKKDFERLVSLDLHTCQLERISPLFFTYLSDRGIPLLRLNLAINQLRRLPSTIGRATRLKWLNLNDNQLTTLPASMCHLVDLAKLGLVQNRLSSLPPPLFSRMLSLEKIDLRRNQLPYLVPSILALAPIQEVNQHIDLAVPATMFAVNAAVDVKYANHVVSRKNSSGREQGGSLKTLLLYENVELEQKDGIFCAMEYNQAVAQQKQQEQDELPTFWTHLISLEKLKSLSIAAQRCPSRLRSTLQSQSDQWSDNSTTDQEEKEWHRSGVSFFFRYLPSLKEVALKNYLNKAHREWIAKHRNSADEHSVDYLSDNQRQLLRRQSVNITSLGHSSFSQLGRLDMDPNTRRHFLTQVFPSWTPCLLRQKVIQQARQCDYCHEWTTILPFQVGYLARLCNNRMQVPIRYLMCSSSCALATTAHLQLTAEVWRTQRLDSAIHLPIPNGSNTIHSMSTGVASGSVTTNSSLSSSSSSPSPSLSPSPSRPATSVPLSPFRSGNERNSSKGIVENLPALLGNDDSPQHQHSVSSSFGGSPSSSKCSSSSPSPSQSSSALNNDTSSSSVSSISLGRVLQRVEQLASSLRDTVTSRPPFYMPFSASLSTPSITPTADIQQHRLSVEAPMLSPRDTLRLTDSRPSLTSFHHLPRDAIRLERF